MPGLVKYEPLDARVKGLKVRAKNAAAIFRSVSRFQTHTPESGDGIGVPEPAEFDDMRMSPFPVVLILLSLTTFAMNT